MDALSRLFSDNEKAPIFALLSVFLIAAAPIIFGTLTWEPSYNSTKFRIYALPIVAIEILLFILAAAEAIRVRKFKISVNKTVVICIFALITLSIMNADQVATRDKPASYRAYLNVAHALAGLSIVWFVQNIRGFAELLVKAIVIGLLVFEVTAFLLLITHPDIAQLDLLKVGFGISNVRQFAFYGSIGVALSLGLALVSPVARSRYFWLACATFNLAFIFWSGSRGGIFALTGMIVLAPFFLPEFRKAWWLLKSFLLISLPAALISLVWIPPSNSWGIARMLKFASAGVSASLEGKESVGLTNGRTTLWREAVDLIQNSPWIGYGEAQFRFLAPSANLYYAHPHNFILQFLVNWGVIGLVLAMIPILFGLRNGRRAGVKLDMAGMPAFLGAVTLLVFGLIDSTLYQIYPLFAFIVLILVAAQRGRAPMAKETPLTVPKPG